MVRRIMAVLGLLAFSITVMGGLASGNSLEFILTRALQAMAVFCVLGLVVGWSAQRVVLEYQSTQREEVFGPEDDEPASADEPQSEENSSTAPIS